jgi:hypothetical protein
MYLTSSKDREQKLRGGQWIGAQQEYLLAQAYRSVKQNDTLVFMNQDETLQELGYPGFASEHVLGC